MWAPLHSGLDGELLSDLKNENLILREELANMCNRMSVANFTQLQFTDLPLTRDVGTCTEWPSDECNLAEIRLHEERLLNVELDRRIDYLDMKIRELEDLCLEGKKWRLEVAVGQRAVTELTKERHRQIEDLASTKDENLRLESRNHQLTEMLILEQLRSREQVGLIRFLEKKINFLEPLIAKSQETISELSRRCTTMDEEIENAGSTIRALEITCQSQAKEIIKVKHQSEELRLLAHDSRNIYQQRIPEQENGQCLCYSSYTEDYLF